MRSQQGLHRVPPAPHVIAQLYADYKRLAKDTKVSFRDYLRVIGFIDPAERMHRADNGETRPAGANVALVAVPSKRVTGTLRVMALLVDFSDNQGERPAHEFEDMLFSRNVFRTGSMSDFYNEVSRGQVEVDGTVHGWLRMPQPYSSYVNNASGLGAYPNNAQRLAEDAVYAALQQGIAFPMDLDKFGQGSITALFIIHGGRGAETLPSVALQRKHIWSHKADLENQVKAGDGLWATNYLTVPENCRMGVCAHEIGHLAFQWDDFYDPNYDEDGSEWDGSGVWDLMAGGSWNDGGNSPAHPAGLHKSQHGWVEIETITQTTNGVILPPYSQGKGKVVQLKSNVFSRTQSLILENRRRGGFDLTLPGQGLLVWRVDTSLEQVSADRPAMLLVQADGRHDLETPRDSDAGDAGDPFPGSSSRLELGDEGDISTSFPGAARSGIRLSDIAVDNAGNVSLNITISQVHG